MPYETGQELYQKLDTEVTDMTRVLNETYDVIRTKGVEPALPVSITNEIAAINKIMPNIPAFSATLEDWNVSNTSALGSSITNIVNGNNIWLAICGGYVIISEDMTSWRRVPGNMQLINIVYFENRFVGVNSAGSLYYSLDNGKTWPQGYGTSMAAPTTSGVRQLVYGAGMLIGMDAANGNVYKYDIVNKNWITKTVAGGIVNMYIKFVNETFFVFTNTTNFYYSKNCDTWTAFSNGTGNRTCDIAFGYDKWCMLSNTGRVFVTNGATLIAGDFQQVTVKTMYETADNYRTITYGNGVFFITTTANASSYNFYISLDGINWDFRKNVGTKYSPCCVCNYMDMWVVGCINQAFILTKVFKDSVIARETATNKYISNGYNGYLEQGIMQYPFPGIGWTSRPSGSTAMLRSIAYGNDVYVIVSFGGTILTSTNGIDWVSRTSGTTVNLYRVTFGIVAGVGIFVAVGQNNTIITSPDGITWTARSSGIASNIFQDVYFDDDVFVAVNGVGNIITSTNGINWTSRTSGVTASLWGTAVYNGTFVVVGDGGVILSSPDLITWTKRTSGITSNLQTVTAGNGRFVAAGIGGVILNSKDGITWTNVGNKFTNDISQIIYYNGLFVSVGASDNTLYTSNDGSAWIKRYVSNTTHIAGVGYGNGLFIATVMNGTILTSGKANAAKPNFQFGTITPTTPLYMFNLDFVPDKCFFVLSGTTTTAGKLFCKINISNGNNFQVNGVPVSTYTIYNNTGTTGTMISDNKNFIAGTKVQVSFPAAVMNDGSVNFEYYFMG